LPNTKKDIIIVGQGIAGSVLALELLNRKKSIVVIDKPQLSASSKVAAGIWNPVVFKRLTKSWMADELIPSLNEFYTEAEITTNTSFVEERKIAKLFTEEQEINLWKKKSTEEMQNYLTTTIYEMQHPLLSKYAIVKQAGNIDTKAFLNATSTYLQQKNSYINEVFDYSLVQLSENGIVYKSTSASQIIFCEGYLIHQNPYFNYLPFKPAKGDVLTIFCKSLSIDFVLNKGIFIMPLGNHLFKIGATYNWQNIHDAPSETAKEELISKFKKIVSYPFELITHESGVRPSVIDRRPVLGTHPKHSNIKLFNGFGTKAVMLAPYFAKHFCDYLFDKKALLKEVDVKRFTKMDA